jgi:protein-disulfide isomerase
MATPGNNTPGKKDRREAAREKARQDREVERKRVRRNKIFLQGGVGIAVIAIAAIVMLVIVNQPKPVALSNNAAGPLNMASDGILLSGPDLAAVTTDGISAKGKPVATDVSQHSKTVNIVEYIDYQCPYCNQFETTNAEQIKSWVASGVATIEIHPIAILDNSSQGTKYSTRAANAAACVANYDPDVFYAVNTALFANQPAEGTSGLSDSKLTSIVKAAGATSDKIPNCITSQKFATWVAAATARVLAGPFPNVPTKQAFSGTPSVFINGEKYPGGLTDANAFATFFNSIANAK